MTHTTKLKSLLVALVVIFGIQNVEAASFHTVALPAWGRPADNSAASSALSTYQEWNSVSPTPSVPTSASRLAAQTLVNPNANAQNPSVWYDSSAPADGAFAAGTDVYSFSGALNPVAIVAGYNVSGNALKVSAEIQTFGSLINVNSLTAVYTDPQGNAHSIAVSSLPSYSYAEAYNDGGTDFGGMGIAYLVDHLWTFTLPQDTASLQLTWGFGIPSAALQALSVDTQSVAVPEPASIVLLGLAGAGCWMCVRRRRSA